MVNIDLNYIVHDAKVQLYFYIASDILKKVEKIPQAKPSPVFISYNQFVFEIAED